MRYKEFKVALRKRCQEPTKYPAGGFVKPSKKYIYPKCVYLEDGKCTITTCIRRNNDERERRENFDIYG